MTHATMEFASETVRNQTLALDAIEQFYSALNQMFAGDVRPMENVWSQSNDVILMNPFGGRLVGRSEVLRGFREDSQVIGSGIVTPRDIVMRVGKELAYCICLQQGQLNTKDGRSVPIDLRGTNIVKREGDAWRLVYHHTDPLPEMQEASSRKIEDFFTPRGHTPKPDVVKALDGFYDGVRKMFGGDLVTLAGAWAKADDVSFASPTGNVEIGFPAIQAEFERHSRMNQRGNLQFKDPLINIAGDMAYASTLSTAPDYSVGGHRLPMSLRTTVIFHREGVQWRVVHLHVDWARAMTDLMK